jgi:protein subunit release factor A
MVSGENEYPGVRFEGGNAPRAACAEEMLRPASTHRRRQWTVLPEAVEIDNRNRSRRFADRRFRSSGPEGKRQYHDSAVRITHIPTGMVVPARMKVAA